MSKKVLVTQVRSAAGRGVKVQRTLSALGLHKIGNVAEHTLNVSIAGMLKKIAYLVRIEESV